VEQLLGVRTILEQYSARLAASDANTRNGQPAWDSCSRTGPEMLGPLRILLANQRTRRALVRQTRAPAASITALGGERRAAPKHIALRSKRKWRVATLTDRQPRGPTAHGRARRAWIKAIAPASTHDQATDIMNSATRNLTAATALPRTAACKADPTSPPRPRPGRRGCARLRNRCSSTDPRRKADHVSPISLAIDGECERTGADTAPGRGPRPYRLLHQFRRKPGHSPISVEPLSGRRPASSATR